MAASPLRRRLVRARLRNIMLDCPEIGFRSRAQMVAYLNAQFDMGATSKLVQGALEDLDAVKAAGQWQLPWRGMVTHAALTREDDL